MRRNLTLLVTVAVLSALAAGCANHDENEWQRLVCEVESVNAGFPLLSAYQYVNTEGDIQGYPVDWVPVLFYARPYSSAITLPEDGAQSWFHITNYDLTWIPGPNAPADITDFNVRGGLCEARVPTNDYGTVSVLIADRVMKEEAWFQDLITTPGSSFTAACELTFYGHESGNSTTVSIPAGFMVTFYGSVNPD